MACILVIDDNADVRVAVRRALEHAGYDVLDAPGGREGVALLTARGADVVITDIFMPGQDGLETLRRIRKAFPTVPVIVASGDHAGLDFLEHARALGAAATLQKPLTYLDLIASVAGVLHRDMGHSAVPPPEPP